MAKELNTLANKKWVADYSGSTPTIDITDGILIGDLAVDNSIIPNIVWKCLDNTDGSPIWNRLSQSSAWVNKTFASTVTFDFLINVNQEITVTGDVLLESPLNIVNGIKYDIKFTMDAIGDHTITLGSAFILLDGDTNYSKGPNSVFSFKGIGTSDGTIEGKYDPTIEDNISQNSSRTLEPNGTAVLSGTTSSTTIMELLIMPNNRFALEDNDAYSCMVRVMGSQADGSMGRWSYEASISRQGSTTALQGVVSSLGTNQESVNIGSPTISITADDTNDALVVKITPANATTTVWAAEISYIKTNF